MPRVPRNLILEEGLQAHKMWRGHNKERNLESSAEKLTYLKYLNRYLKKQTNELNAYTLMSNHSHEQYDIKNIREFSNLMRDHHSRYGRFFNIKHKRDGKVAYERPKTCLIGDDDYSIRATLYIHANPLRAGMVKNALNYRWSTHKLYALGKREKFTEFIKFPNWYIALGKTWSDRQRKYRKLFDAYLRETGLIKQDFLKHNFYGSYTWTENLSERVKSWVKSGSKSNSPP